MKGKIDRIQIMKLQQNIKFIYFIRKFRLLAREEQHLLDVTSLITTIRENTQLCVPETLWFIFVI